jgi:hypothetical protein
MKKRMLIALLVALVLATTASVAWADDPVEYTNNIVKENHKVKNKWDLSGTFVAHPGYNWGGLAEGATWTYRIHIKEAMDGEASVGSIHFMTGDIDVVGHVEATARYYNYWSGDNLAAVGRAEYEGTSYYFMFLYAERAIWFALSETPYDYYWENQTVWGGSLRAYQLHSKVPDETFTLDYKIIHEQE